MRLAELDEAVYMSRATLRSHIEALSAPERKKLFDITLDLRKFEIDLYWKRSTYYWAFTVVAFAAFGVIAGRINHVPEPLRYSLLPVVASVGLIFALALYLSSRGSSYWHAHWETLNEEVARLEIGDFFRVMLDPRSGGGIGIGAKLFNAYPASVTKINAIVALALSVVWLGLLLSFTFTYGDLSLTKIFNLLFVVCWVAILLTRTRSTGVPSVDGNDEVVEQTRFIVRASRQV